MVMRMTTASHDETDDVDAREKVKRIFECSLKQLIMG